LHNAVVCLAITDDKYDVAGVGTKGATQKGTIMVKNCPMSSQRIIDTVAIIRSLASLAAEDGYLYRRTFADASVILAVKRRTAEIQWRTLP